MGTEIERKFLIEPSHLPPLELVPWASLHQGYLTRSEPSGVPRGATVRVRVRESSDGTASAYLTVKGPGLMTRAEFEYAIPVSDGLELLALCQTRLEKVRYFLELEGKIWEVDRFSGRLTGLWLAEVELSTPDEPLTSPVWLRKEVTDDPRYSNAVLADSPAPPHP